MQIPRWIWKIDLVGVVAIANLLCLGACLLVYLDCCGPNAPILDPIPKWKLELQSRLWFLIAILTFPVGWLSGFFLPMHGVTYTVLLFFPLNAYAWGYFAQRLWRSGSEDRDWRE